MLDIVVCAWGLRMQGSDFPVASRAHRRAVDPGRRARHPVAHAGAETSAALGAAAGHRQPRGRRRHHRHRNRRQGRSRRPHAAGGGSGLRGEPVPLRQAALSHAAGLHRHHRAGYGAKRARGSSVGCRDLGARTDCAGEGEAGRVGLRHRPGVGTSGHLAMELFKRMARGGGGWGGSGNFPCGNASSASYILRSISMPSRRLRARSRNARSPGRRISSTPGWRGVALTRASISLMSRRKSSSGSIRSGLIAMIR